MIVKDIMCHDLHVVTPDMLVSEVGLFLTNHGISGAPVADRSGKLVGVISLRDLAANTTTATLEQSSHKPYYFRDLWMEEAESGSFVIENAGGVKVQDIMTPAVYTIHETASLNALVDLMMRSSIHRVIVVDESETPRGIVTTTDLMRLVPLLLTPSALA